MKGKIAGLQLLQSKMYAHKTQVNFENCEIHGIVAHSCWQAWEESFIMHFCRCELTFQSNLPTCNEVYELNVSKSYVKKPDKTHYNNTVCHGGVRATVG